MKFSTLTKPDLIESYGHVMSKLIWGQVNAGITRHELDWLYGINLSRALTNSIKVGGGGFKILSSGRVQGPALKILVDKEKEILAFIPTPYWQLNLNGKKGSDEFNALHKIEKFVKKDEVDAIYDKIKDEKNASVKDIKSRDFKQAPPTPFDLTSLQLEAHRTLGIVPKQTLEIAQRLYIEGLISYPRTSSQKLPPSLGFKKILTQLSKQTIFKDLANKLLKLPSLKPNEGKKTDDAHPSIYPTGQSKKLEGRDMSLYELIVRRFMAVFSEPATRQTNTVLFDVNTEPFVLKGTRTIKLGWQEFYGRFVQQKEEELPKFEMGENVKIKKLTLDEKMTKPPNRYTAASIIKELEKRNLGTKSTRAQIVENLYDRGYVHEKSIQASELGIKLVDILDKHSPEILNEKLTRHFEEEMELIRKEKVTHDKVLDDSKETLTKILNDFKSKEKEIGKDLALANKETVNEAVNVGKCLKCKEGDLIIRRGKFGQFIGCNKYPDCKTIFNIPNGAKVKPAKKSCEICKHPIIIIAQARKRPVEMCINPECETRKMNGAEEKQAQEIEKGKIEKKCPKCGKTLVLKSGFYGKFLACPGFPTCRHTEKLVEEDKKVEEEKKVKEE